MWTKPDFAALSLSLAPALAGYGMNAVCPRAQGHYGDAIPFRPPPMAFKIVWPIMYALLGRSIYLHNGDWMALSLHMAIALGLAAWIPLTSCYNKRKEGVWLLLLCVMLCGYAMSMDSAAFALLLPLLVWLCFATLMNAWSVDPTQNK